METLNDTIGVDVMVDIETLSTDPGNALVLSIGAMWFTRSSKSAGLIVVPDIKEQLLMGRAVDRATQVWWSEREQAAQEHWMNPGETLSVSTALLRLGDYLRGAQRVWANGVVFDIGNLTSLYNAVRLPVPWKYNAIRDARTMYNEVQGELRVTGTSDAGPLHDPLADCRWQIEKLWAHWPDYSTPPVPFGAPART